MKRASTTSQAMGLFQSGCAEDKKRHYSMC